MAAMVKRYALEECELGWQRILGGVRYQMELEEFSGATTLCWPRT